MPRSRAKDQTVDAFSAPRELLRAAQMEAKKRRWTKSGFYRYCLAKELGWSEDAAIEVAGHAAIGQFSIVNHGIQQSGVNNTATISHAQNDSTKPQQRNPAKRKRKQGGTA